MEIIPLGDSALLVRVTDEVLEVTEQLRACHLDGVIEFVPAYTTVGVFYDATEIRFEELRETISTCLTSAKTVAPAKRRPRLVEIPVCYDAEFAPDLDDVAQHTGLTSTEIVQRHSAAQYRVSCVGFTPGFAYLSGLPAELATPRRATPRKEVPAGAVAIGGTQTGVYPQVSPGGWNVIGRTPLRFFELERKPPALLQAGDQVRFIAISRQDYDATTR